MIDPVPAEVTRESFEETFTVVEATAPALSVGELSTQRGDGVFETIGVIDGHPQEVTAHLDRLAHSAALCDLPAPNTAQWRAAIEAAAADTGAGEWAIKLILSRGVEHGPTPTAWVTAAAASDFSDVRRTGVRVVTLDRGCDLGAAARAPWLLMGAKTLSYAVNMAALREAKRRGADDAIFVTTDGYVLEAPTASLILRFGDRFVTARPSGGILQGTTQLSVYEHLTERGWQTEYADIPASELPDVDGAWLVSSLRLAVHITAIDARPIPVDPALTEELNAYLRSPR